MAILIDYNQIAIANAARHAYTDPGTPLDEDLLRHLMLASLLFYKTKFQRDFGEIIICADGRSPWRRDFFKEYKCKRKTAREKSPIDYENLFPMVNKIKEELKEHSPYKVIWEDKAEGDDVIAVLVEHLAEQGEETVIVSSDQDFYQLHKHPTVRQWSPHKKDFVKPECPKLFLREHIFTGDDGDSIPNFLSPDNSFSEKIRQKGVSKKKLQDWILLEDYSTFEPEIQKNLYRNTVLIDFSHIPEEVKKAVMDNFLVRAPGSRTTLRKYFMEKRLRNLLEHLSEF